MKLESDATIIAALILVVGVYFLATNERVQAGLVDLSQRIQSQPEERPPADLNLEVPPTPRDGPSTRLPNAQPARRAPQQPTVYYYAPQSGSGNNYRSSCH